MYNMMDLQQLGYGFIVIFFIYCHSTADGKYLGFFFVCLFLSGLLLIELVEMFLDLWSVMILISVTIINYGYIKSQVHSKSHITLWDKWWKIASSVEIHFHEKISCFQAVFQWLDFKWHFCRFLFLVKDAQMNRLRRGMLRVTDFGHCWLRSTKVEINFTDR